MDNIESKLGDIRKRYAEACDAKFYADEKAENATLAVEEAIESGASSTEVLRLEEEERTALDALGPLQDKCDKLSIALKGFVRMVEDSP